MNTVIVPVDLVHPPVVTTALGFGFNSRQAETLVLFAGALVAALVSLQRRALTAHGRRNR